MSPSVECALMREAIRWPRVRPSARRFAQIGALTSAVATLIGCAQNPTPRHVSSREHFSSKIYGKASPRVVADGEAVPRGGGMYLVGHAYKIAGHTYVPRENDGYTAVGMASWYGDAFQGRRTANGEVYDKESISAAHPTMPLPSYARVTNLGNGHSISARFQALPFPSPSPAQRCCRRAAPSPTISRPRMRSILPSRANQETG